MEIEEGYPAINYEGQSRQFRKLIMPQLSKTFKRPGTNSKNILVQNYEYSFKDYLTRNGGSFSYRCTDRNCKCLLHIPIKGNFDNETFEFLDKQEFKATLLLIITQNIVRTKERIYKKNYRWLRLMFMSLISMFLKVLSEKIHF